MILIIVKANDMDHEHDDNKIEECLLVNQLGV